MKTPVSHGSCKCNAQVSGLLRRSQLSSQGFKDSSSSLVEGTKVKERVMRQRHGLFGQKINPFKDSSMINIYFEAVNKIL